MGRQNDKKILRFIGKPNDYSFQEMNALLNALGHHLKKGGTTAGSITTYVNKDGGQPVHFHKPHQHKHFGKTTMDSVYTQLDDYKLIDDSFKNLQL
jgi:hypothetical protein